MVPAKRSTLPQADRGADPTLVISTQSASRTSPGVLERFVVAFGALSSGHLEVARPTSNSAGPTRLPSVLHTRARFEIGRDSRAWEPGGRRRSPSPHREWQARPVVIGTTGTPTASEAFGSRAGWFDLLCAQYIQSTAIDQLGGKSGDRGTPSQGGFPRRRAAHHVEAEHCRHRRRSRL